MRFKRVDLDKRAAIPKRSRNSKDIKIQRSQFQQNSHNYNLFICAMHVQAPKAEYKH